MLSFLHHIFSFTVIRTFFFLCFFLVNMHNIVFAAASTIPITTKSSQEFVQDAHQRISQEPKVDIQFVHDAPSKNLLIAIRIEPPKGQYIYAYDDTYALPLRVSLNGGVQIQYPESTQRKDQLDPTKTVRVYDTLTTVFISLPPNIFPNTSIDIGLSFLMCSPTACTPFQNTYTLDIPASAPPLASSPLLKAYDLAVHTESLTPAKTVISPMPSSQTNAPVKAWGALESEIQKNEAQANSLQTSEILWQFTPQEANALFTPTSLWPALLLGLLAGLILNVMPCVLPVITIKLTSLLNAANTIDPQEAQRHFREHNIFFATGIIIYFIILAVFMGLSGLAWGSLFQLVPVVFGLLVMVFSFALSMFGVFTLPAPQVQASSSKNARFQSFITGFFVTLLATPCSGPLLGGVLGWAATQSLPTLVMVFFAMGIGMASPYLMLSTFPTTVRFLPKPGAWTQIFEYIVGFLLLATSLYLLSILPDNMLMPSLFALIVIAFALWIWGKWGYLAPVRQQSLAGLCSAVLIIAAISFVFMPTNEKYITQSFSETQFANTLGKRPIMLIFTADWCPSCKVLEQSVLTPETLQAWEKDYDLTILEVDITDHNPRYMELLRSLNSISIPLLAVFPTGEKAYEPYILRDFFTQAGVERVLKSLQDTE